MAIPRWKSRRGAFTGLHRQHRSAPDGEGCRIDPGTRISGGESETWRHAAADIQRMRRSEQRSATIFPFASTRIGVDKSDAIEALQQMESLNIQHCEEPVSRRAFFELPRSGKRSDPDHESR